MNTIREKRATYVKQWRVGERQNRCFITLAADYLLNKYPAIYNEISSFYGTLNAKYNTKHNLTKTNEYRAWKSEQRAGRTTDQEISTEPTTEQEMSTEPTTDQEISTEPTTEQEMSTEPTTDQEISTEPTTDQEISTEPTTEQEISTEPTTEQETSTEPTTEQELIPQYHLEGMDNILKGLIEELSQDDDLRTLMNGPFEFEDDQHLW